MIAQACTPQGFVGLTVAATAVGITAAIVTGTVHFSIPPGSNLALVVAETGPVRWRDDGIAPTPTSGMLMEATQPPFPYSGDLGALQFISVSGTVAVDISIYKAVG